MPCASQSARAQPTYQRPCTWMASCLFTHPIHAVTIHWATVAPLLNRMEWNAV